MRLPIVGFACGVALLQVQADLPAADLIGILAGLALGGILLALRRASPLSTLLSFVCCAVLGFAWAGGMAKQRLADQLPETWQGRDIEITGIIAALPQRFERGERFVFDVELTNAASTAGVTNAASIAGVTNATAIAGEVPPSVPRRIALSWYHAWDEGDDGDEGDVAGEGGAVKPVRPGERWRFTVRLKRPHGNANAHGFDYEAWLLERDIRATGTIRQGKDAARLSAFVWRAGTVVERLRDIVRSRFVAALADAPYVGVLIALAVGDQRAIPNEQWTIFSRTGITHLVSISGLHVTMIAALLAGAVNALWRRSERLMLRLPAQKAAVVAGWLAAFMYTLLAGFEVPAQRTLYMLTVLAVALWSGRNLGASRTLLLALLAVLLLDPWAVLATGFWLSFGAVALLFYAGSSRLGSVGGWRASLAQWGLTQWAVTVGSVPLLLLFFQQFSLVSPLANALAIPLVSFVITPLALLFAVIPWPPLLYADHWLLAQLMRLLEWLAQWPVWQQAAPPLWASLIALAGVIWLLLPRGFPARWLGLCLLLPALFWPAPRPPPGAAWVDVLDVGQGLAVLVRTAEHSLLYDTGPAYSAQANAGLRVVVPFLRAAGIGRLDTLVVSHRDKDHSGGTRAVQEHLAITRTLSSVAELGERCRSGQRWHWDGVDFSVLHPLPADYQNPSRKSNNMSCVVHVATAGGSVLLSADIEAADERALIARSPSLLPSTVLLAPHHGGNSSSTPEFIAAVGPREVIFSAGYRNSFNHPRPEVLARYAASRQWRTDRDGALRIVLGDTANVTAWRSERRRYWYGQ